MNLPTPNFGRDTSCTTGLRHGRIVTGPRLVAESIYRRLTTPRGMLRGGEEEQNFGLDLTELIGSASTPALEAALPGRIETEIRKDERIESVEIAVLATTSGPATSYTITIRAVTGMGPFTLAIAASAVTVELLGIEVEDGA